MTGTWRGSSRPGYAAPSTKSQRKHYLVRLVCARAALTAIGRRATRPGASYGAGGRGIAAGRTGLCAYRTGPTVVATPGPRPLSHGCERQSAQHGPIGLDRGRIARERAASGAAPLPTPTRRAAILAAPSDLCAAKPLARVEGRTPPNDTCAQAHAHTPSMRQRRQTAIAIGASATLPRPMRVDPPAGPGRRPHPEFRPGGSKFGIFAESAGDGR